MSRCQHSDLEALAYGELAPERARAVRDHVAQCTPCRTKLHGFELERRLFQCRALADPHRPPPFSDVLARLRRLEDASRRRRRRVYLALGFAAAASAAGVLVTTGALERLQGPSDAPAIVAERAFASAGPGAESPASQARPVSRADRSAAPRA